VGVSLKKIFPQTKLKKVDVLEAKGALGVGCYVKDGKLIPAINTVRKLGVALNVINFAWYSAVAKKYIVAGMKSVWVSDGEMSTHSMGIAAIDRPSLLESSSGGVNTAMVTGSTTYFLIGEKCMNKPFKGAVHSCVLKNGRVFGIDNTDLYKIKWSGEGGVDDWTEGISGAGWTTVQYGYGSILNLIVYKDKIVAVREYGLTLFSAYGTPENYKLSYIARKLPKIFADTAAVVEDKLMFYTEDGLYVYDGNKIEKSTLELAEEIASPRSVSCGKGKYFLCGVSKTLEKKAVLVVDALHDCSYIIDAQINAVAAGERIFGYADKEEFALEEGGKYSFTSGEIDFSASGFKVLREVILDGAKDVKIEVSNGVISRIVGGVRGKFRPNMRGKSFKITVCGSGKIKGISAVAEVLDEI